MQQLNNLFLTAKIIMICGLWCREILDISKPKEEIIFNNQNYILRQKNNLKSLAM